MITIVSLLSSTIYQNNDIWRSDESGALRVAAAALRYKSLSTTGTCIILSQGGYADEKKPSLSKVMCNELFSLGVPEAAIVCEENSRSTHQQLLQLQKIVAEKMPDAIEIVSSSWHLPRIQAMLECVPELVALTAASPTLVSAEDVLLKEDLLVWRARIDAIHALPDVRELIAQELLGVEQLHAGTYHFR